MVLKVSLVLGFVLALFVAESSCQKFIQPTFRPWVPNNRPRLILPTYRPPPSKPILRLARAAGEFASPSSPTEEDVTVSPLVYVHLNRTARSLDSPGAKRGGGSHSTSSGSRNTGATHPGYNRRNTRSLDSPSAKRGGGSPRTSSGSRNTGPTHPGYNRRNARDIRLPGDHNPFKPLYPRPTVPAPVFPILARTARDIQIPGIKKPTHCDVIIPNWNPNVRTSPWERIGGRHRRSMDDIEVELGAGSHERETRDVHVSGLPELKKPTYRDVVIPNWNPHVRTNPWNSLGGGRRH